MSFLALIVALAALFLLGDLRRRVDNLEKNILGKRAPLQAPTPEPIKIRPQEIATFNQQAQQRQISYEPDAWDRFIEWIKEDWLMKLGAFLVLLGFGWLVTYAFLNNWIGPAGRIFLGIIAGSLFMVAGFWRIRSYIHQGGLFLVLGSTVILLTVFAAREIYGFFTPLSALMVMFLSTAFVALASVQYNSKSLSLASLALAGIAPLLTNSPQPKR